MHDVTSQEMSVQGGYVLCVHGAHVGPWALLRCHLAVGIVRDAVDIWGGPQWVRAETPRSPMSHPADPPRAGRGQK